MPFFANKKSTAGLVSLSNTRVFGLESGTSQAIASSVRQAGPSLGLAFIGPRCQVSGRFGVARECRPKGGCRLREVNRMGCRTGWNQIIGK
jgi:hypothetical protein